MLFRSGPAERRCRPASGSGQPRACCPHTGTGGAALPADQGVCLFPLCRCHAVKGTVLLALYGRQSFIWVLFHVFPPFCFPLPFSPKRLPASSSQAAYRSFHRKRQNSLAPLLLLSPQSHAALRGPRQWRRVSPLVRKCGASPAGVSLSDGHSVFKVQLIDELP